MASVLLKLCWHFQTSPNVCYSKYCSNNVLMLFMPSRLELVLNVCVCVCVCVHTATTSLLQLKTSELTFVFNHQVSACLLFISPDVSTLIGKVTALKNWNRYCLIRYLDILLRNICFWYTLAICFIHSHVTFNILK